MNEKNIIVAYNSKNKGEALKKFVEEKIKDCKILLINSEERTSNQSICNSENWDKYQLIIHTSCISSGTSFVKEHFHRQYTFIDPRCVSSSTEVVQSIFRSRILLDKENSINIVIESWFETGYIHKSFYGNVIEFLRRRNYNMRQKFVGVKKDKTVLSDEITEKMSSEELLPYFYHNVMEKVRIYETGELNQLDESDPFFKLYCYQLHREHFSRINMLEEVLALLREKGVKFGKFKTETIQIDDEFMEDDIEYNKKIKGEIKEKLNEVKEKNIDNIINAQHINSLDELTTKKIKTPISVSKNFKIRKIYGHTHDNLKTLNRNVVKELIRNVDVAERHNFILENEEKIIAPSGKSYDKSLADIKARIATCMIRWAGFNGLHDINRFIKPNILKLKEWMKNYESEFPEIKGFKLSPVQFLNKLCEGTLLVRIHRMYKTSDHYCIKLISNNTIEVQKSKEESITCYDKKFEDKASIIGEFKQIKCEDSVMIYEINDNKESKDNKECINGNFSKISKKVYYRICGNDNYEIINPVNSK
jgi:hypothetical protein